MTTIKPDDLGQMISEGQLRPRSGARPHPRAVGHGATPLHAISAPPVLQVPDTGSYTRMFPNLPGYVPDTAPLIALGMQGGPMDLGENPPILSTTIPAGFTYFGQFLDHNITFQADATFDLGNQPSATTNFHSARISLEHVYGLGPETQAFEYYDKDVNGAFWIDPVRSFDVPRNDQGVAIIADPRNDNTVITIQIHLALMKFHNAVVNMLSKTSVEPDMLFATAHQLVVWHFQWIVVNEWLRLILEPSVYGDIFANGPKYYTPEAPIRLPVEFTVAGYRLHPLVLEDYALNDALSGDLFTGLRQPFAPLDPSQRIDWSYFFEFPATHGPQFAKRFEAKISTGFLDMPGPIDTPLDWPANIPAEQALRSIAVRNLLRARAFALPSGQAVASFMGLTPFTQSQLGLADSGLTEAPLWYYVMKEAELETNGATLGTVGSRIVGEVFLGILLADTSSYLSADPAWTPTLGTDGTFTMADLLTIAGVYPYN